MQMEAPASENLPATQSEQVSLAVAPLAAENLPLTHGTQSVTVSSPFVTRYVPAAQLVHVTAP